MKRNFKYSLIAAALLCTNSLHAQTNLSYQLPPKSIVDLIDAPAESQVQVSKDGKYLLLLESPGFSTIEQVSQPVLGIAGLRINPKNNTTVGEQSGVYSGIQLKNLTTSKLVNFTGLPTTVRISQLQWSGTGEHISFVNQTNDAVELWVVDVKSLQARKIYNGKINDTYGTTYQWHPSGKSLLVQTIVDSRGPVPQASEVPTGPIVQENLGVTTPSRTYQNLLSNTHDVALMSYYLTSQLVSVSLDGQTQKIGAPAIYKKAAYSPDGNYLLTQTVQAPYSYLVPIYMFPYQTAVLDVAGNTVKVLANTPLAEKMPISFDAVMEGPRNYDWRKDQASTLVFAQAKDGGNPAVKSEIRDELFILEAPFAGEARKIFSANYRINGLIWGNDQLAIVQEMWRKDRSTKTSLINPSLGTVNKVLSIRSSEDTYADPGSFVLNNKGLLLLDKSKDPVAFTTGLGASKEGDRPFLLKWNLATNKQDTLFKSRAPYYEAPIFFDNAGKVIIAKESVELPTNYYSVNLKNRKEESLTSFADPYPSLQGVQKSLLAYPRKDGVKLTATLYLPKDFKKGDAPLPALVWAYPREFKSLAAAGQVKGSPYRYTRLAFRSPVFWVTRGYAILDQADMPIVGEGDMEPNDTFLAQIEENAKALINYVSDDLKVVDRQRIGVGGHSYGAFMTANLLAHTNLFAAGIARSGAYNRTLTPFGFQGETRTFWEAQDVYNKMSPFFVADKIKTPILLTHGVDDENSGTFPIQSERLYAAIKGHGGTVRLVLLPKEFHGYRSRESILHTFWEQDQWLEKYVKNKK
ncbi:S9 family peptidase [Sphingobacteriaceae bacterium WQ 2009]|uniref:S9 family peptidase n=1 Tax=Rhinopithecimicrobium faecis TaxID=2820698 RepID=A0A8T4H983_9SPHI|nr:S9 family peptidase [Sphingobacteriaceae bacterium WQ 2009]